MAETANKLNVCYRYSYDVLEAASARELSAAVTKRIESVVKANNDARFKLGNLVVTVDGGKTQFYQPMTTTANVHCIEFY